MLAGNCKRYLVGVSRLILLSGLCLFSGKSLSAQNLIPNPGFEDRYSCNLLIEQAFTDDAPPWYVVAGTPDLLQIGCDDPPVWQNIDFDLYQYPDLGNASVYIAGGAGNAGGFSTEGIGVPLLQTLKADRRYLFTARILPVAWDIGGVRRCAEPKHALNVYFHDGPIEIFNDQQEAVLINSTVNTPVDLQFTGHKVTPQIGFRDEDVKVWRDVIGCYDATGGETHLALSHNVGQVISVSPPCEVSEGAEGLLNLFGYHLDNLALVEIPDRIETEREICVGIDNQIQLDSLLPEGLRNRGAVFRWADGFEGSQRTLRQSGDYDLQLEFQCVSIPLVLTLTDAQCTGDVLAANAFTPNADGVNDVWELFVRSEYPIVEYELRVYDRFGKAVFSTDDPAQTWRGDNGGKGGLPAGAYFWQLRYTIAAFGTEIPTAETGTVILLR